MNPRLILLIGLLLSGCASYSPYVPPSETPDDRWETPQPQPRDVTKFEDGVERQVIRQGDQLVDPGRGIRLLADDLPEAYNADPFGEVRDNSWFTNRVSLLRGDSSDLNELKPGAIAFPLRVTRLSFDKEQPLIEASDGDGVGFALRFDVPGYPELATGAEVVAGNLMYAAGYNVPDMGIADLTVWDLVVTPGLIYTDPEGDKRVLTDAGLDSLLSPYHNGQKALRAAIVKKVDGIPSGGFLLYGHRSDDPNDFIPHEQRRELRALRLFSAWINNYDILVTNTEDYWTHGRVIHYFTRFTSVLGASVLGPQPPARGFENYVDPLAFAFSTLSLGLVVHPWERLSAVAVPAVGNFTAERFDPADYEFVFPVPAFENMTPNDGFWMAKIIAGFDDNLLRRIVCSGSCSDSAAADTLVSVLAHRRDIICRNYFTRMTPADRFILASGSYSDVLTFTDLAVRYGLRTASETVYRVAITRDGKPLTTEREFTGEPRIILPKLQTTNASGQWELTLQAKTAGEPHFAPPVHLYLQANSSGKLETVGIVRDHCL